MAVALKRLTPEGLFKPAAYTRATIFGAAELPARPLS